MRNQVIWHLRRRYETRLPAHGLTNATLVATAADWLQLHYHPRASATDKLIALYDHITGRAPAKNGRQRICSREELDRRNERARRQGTHG